MNGAGLQRWIDEFHATSSQQWLLRLVGLLAPLCAMGAVAAEVGDWWLFGTAVVGALAAASTVRPDAPTAIIVIGIAGWHWLAMVDPVDTPWLPVAAICLFVYHSVIALTATLPVGGVIPTPTVLKWLRQIGLVSAATVALWLVVVLFDRRDGAGNGLLTGAALAAVAAGAWLIHSRSIDTEP